ncbi:hypothetical protein RhiJN_15024 [Ceratobasidium sp. AG-Ba]|nr:hypothetical protein RhiJN_15024 [Ceratobasidium sp. AG-Ba]
MQNLFKGALEGAFARLKAEIARRKAHHARDVALGMCEIKHTNSMNIELLHGQGGVPVYWDANKVLHPHYSRLFDEKSKAWGEEFYNAATDEPRVPDKHKTCLKTTLQVQLCESSSVTFKSMVYLYLAQKDTDGVANEKSAARARQAGRKKD